MAFIRFVLPETHPDSCLNEGIFRLAYRLRTDPAVDEADRCLLTESMNWLDKHLPVPTRFNRSNSKGYNRRNTRGIGWFRDTATDCVTRMFTVKRILEAQGHQVTLIRENRVGYVVYEDTFQVVAEPFRDTDTGSS